MGIPPPLPCRYTPSLSRFLLSFSLYSHSSSLVSLKCIYAVLLSLTVYTYCVLVHVLYLLIIGVCLHEPHMCACICFGCVYTYACVSACQYDMVGPEGIVESHQITRDGKAGATEAVDCKWYIRAPPRSKVSDVNYAPIKLWIWFEAKFWNVTWNKMEMKLCPH